MDNKEIDQLLSDENEHLDKLHQIVKEALKAEKLIIRNLLNPPLEILTQGQKISDKVARFGGSWRFIILFGIVLTLWIIFNVVAIGHYKFDPYPFILMNLILSCIAALQAPVIMCSAACRGDGCYSIRFCAVPTPAHTPHDRTMLASQCQDFAHWLEGRCRNDPYNWFNFYDFWATPARD